MSAAPTMKPSILFGDGIGDLLAPKQQQQLHPTPTLLLAAWPCERAIGRDGLFLLIKAYTQISRTISPRLSRARGPGPRRGSFFVSFHRRHLKLIAEFRCES